MVACTQLPACLSKCAQGSFAVDIVSARDVLLLSKLARNELSYADDSSPQHGCNNVSGLSQHIPAIIGFIAELSYSNVMHGQVWTAVSA